jgi:hypothetical protein
LVEKDGEMKLLQEKIRSKEMELIEELSRYNELEEEINKLKLRLNTRPSTPYCFVEKKFFDKEISDHECVCHLCGNNFSNNFSHSNSPQFKEEGTDSHMAVKNNCRKEKQEGSEFNQDISMDLGEKNTLRSPQQNPELSYETQVLIQENKQLKESLAKAKLQVDLLFQQVDKLQIEIVRIIIKKQ